LNATSISLVAFGCTLMAALAAIYIRERLPAHHLKGDSQEFLKLVLGLIATITALVLGLLISSAHSSFDGQQAEVQRLSVDFYQIDRILARFGADAADDRTLLHNIVASDIERIWAKDQSGSAEYAPLSAEREAGRLFDGIAGLPTKTDLERFGQSRALQLLAGVAETRRLLAEQSRGSLSAPFMIVLICWLAVLFFGFGLFTRINATVVAALVVGCLSVAGAIFLILEMNRPFGGWMQVSSAPLRDALAQMSR
jgi:hypothetical protein